MAAGGRHEAQGPKLVLLRQVEAIPDGSQLLAKSAAMDGRGRTIRSRKSGFQSCPAGLKRSRTDRNGRTPINPDLVIPAEAGIQPFQQVAKERTPAFAGMMGLFRPSLIDPFPS